MLDLDSLITYMMTNLLHALPLECYSLVLVVSGKLICTRGWLVLAGVRSH